MDNLTSPSNISGCPLSFETGGTMGYNCCFFLNFVPLQIESPYNFGSTGPILGIKKPLQRVNGHAVYGMFWFSVLLFQRRGFAPGFVNYKKCALDSQPQVIKFTSCLPMVGGSLRVLRLLPPLILVAMM